jgi:hypothetical protein
LNTDVLKKAKPFGCYVGYQAFECIGTEIESCYTHVTTPKQRFIYFDLKKRKRGKEEKRKREKDYFKHREKQRKAEKSREKQRKAET